jgi:hypothetical protein
MPTHKLKIIPKEGPTPEYTGRNVVSALKGNTKVQTGNEKRI